MEDFEKQETIENIKARVEALKKNAVPLTYVPGNQEPGSTVKIGETLYRVANARGTIKRIDEKEPSKIRKQREAVSHILSLKNPNLKNRLEREERINKIKIFNNVQKISEKNIMNMNKPLHPKVFIPTIKENVVEASTEASASTEEQNDSETTSPKSTFDFSAPSYIEMMRINSKKRILNKREEQLIN